MIISLIFRFSVFLKLDSVNEKIRKFFFLVKLKRYEIQSNQKINFVKQGTYDLSLLGDLNFFKIHLTSHLKSGTTIECTGGVEIGKYFHTGKGLTIFSTNHNWKHTNKIPYDEKIILEKVVIKDFVWLGANVTVVPGVTIGEGAVVGAGSVVTKNIPPCSVVGGNPARIIKYRDKALFYKLKNDKAFF